LIASTAVRAIETAVSTSPCPWATAEQHDGVGVIRDRHELAERRLGEARLVEAWNVHVEQIAKQAGGKCRLLPDQRNHAFMNHRWRRHEYPL
jgi:hypothetical protein